MFEEFSSGYYLGRLYVEPHDGDCAVMQRDQHERVNEQLYPAPTSEGGETPLVMKFGRRHFSVHGQEGVPADTLALPWTYLENSPVRNPPELAEVLLAKADRAVQLLDMAQA